MDKDKEIKLTPGVKRSLKSILKKVELYRKDELLLELEKASTKEKLLFLSSWSIEYLLIRKSVTFDRSQSQHGLQSISSGK